MTPVRRVDAVTPPALSSCEGSAESLLPADLVPGIDESTPWAYRTKRFRILSFDFALRTTDGDLGRYIDEAFDASAVNGEPTAWYSVIAWLEGRYSHQVFIGRSRLMSASWPSVVPRVLTWDVNRRAIDTGQASHLLLHAGAVARAGRGLLLPGAMEAGKTTLVAGLLRAGFYYLTDEAAAIDPESSRVEPFAKPLSLDCGSWPLFPDAKPQLIDRAVGYANEQWQVSPNSFRPCAVSSSVPVKYVVFPRYVAGAKTALRPVEATDALIRLLAQTFGFREQADRNVTALGRLVERTKQYELTVGDLARACEVLTELVESGDGEDAQAALRCFR
jgi:hypothetical protein